MIHPEDDEDPYPDVTTKRLHDSLQELGQASAYTTLLRLSEDRVLSLVEKSPRSDRESQKIEEFLYDLWRAYPIEEKHDGNEIVYRLGNAKPGTLDDYDIQNSCSSAAAAFSEGLAAEHDDVPVQWNPSHHNDMSEEACDPMDLYDWQAEDIYEAADEPDDYGCLACDASLYTGGYLPDEIEGPLDDGLSTLGQHYTHFYDPDVTVAEYCDYEINVGSIGGAPDETESLFEHVNNNCCSTKREYLGYALHYIQDMGVPLHTGAGIEQVNFGIQCTIGGCGITINPYEDLHYAYEGFVADNFYDEAWYLDEPFVEEFRGLPSAYIIDSPKQAIKDFAEYTTQFSLTVFDELLEEGWDNPYFWDDEIYDLTYNCMYRTGSYTRAFLREEYDWD